MSEWKIVSDEDIKPKKEATNEVKTLPEVDFKKLFKMGVNYAVTGGFYEAIICFDAALKMNPQSVEIWNHKGIVLTHLKKYDEASKCYNKALEINSKNINVWFNKGLMLAKQELFQQALDCYDQALKMDPNYIPAHQKRKIALRKI